MIQFIALGLLAIGALSCRRSRVEEPGAINPSAQPTVTTPQARSEDRFERVDSQRDTRIPSSSTSPSALRCHIYGNYHESFERTGEEPFVAQYQAVLARTLYRENRAQRGYHHIFYENLTFNIPPSDTDLNEARRIRDILGANFFTEPVASSENTATDRARIQVLTASGGGIRVYALLKNLEIAESEGTEALHEKGVFLHQTVTHEMFSEFTAMYRTSSTAEVNRQREMYLGTTIAEALQNDPTLSDIDIVMGILHLNGLPNNIINGINLAVSRFGFQVPITRFNPATFSKTCFLIPAHYPVAATNNHLCQQVVSLH